MQATRENPADRSEPGTPETADAPFPTEKGRSMQIAVDTSRRAVPAEATHVMKARAEELSFFYGTIQALKSVTIEIRDKQVTALIGPSGCGKSTFLRCFNRMHDLTPDTRYEGRVMLYPDGIDLVSRKVDPIEVRMRIGMVFQKPNPFPKTIFENVAYGLRVRGMRAKVLVEEEVEKALRGAALWDEVKDRLHSSRMSFSGG
jgi:phosphate transport system ATP-binding protein